MKVEIVQNGQVLQTINHNDTQYVVAPESGEYTIRLTNPYWRRQLAVISVDGINVIDGAAASYEGQGYVIGGGQTVEIPGWRRTDNKVAAFEFSAQDASYSAQMGKGTSNVGVIGVAVFAEKEHVHVPFPPVYRGYYNTMDSLDLGDVSTSGPTCSTNTMLGGGEGEVGTASVYSATTKGTQGTSVVRSRSVATTKDVGTAYGQETSFHTSETKFERKTTEPRLLTVLRYATKERLRSWGVPVAEPTPTGPNPFPASQKPSVPAPPGWNR